MITYVESSSGGFVTNTRTLCVSNMVKRVFANGEASYSSASLVVQITSKGAYLLDYDMALQEYTQECHWNPSGEGLKPPEIVAASVNASQVLLALSNGRLTCLVLENSRFKELM